jgi:geranylgeranyl pyrophosphate synthase/predicted secreted hydrolase
MPSTFPTWNESPHPESTLEWWFVHGYYESASVSRRYFMTTLFRHGVMTKGDERREGFSYLQSDLDVKGDGLSVSSRFDRAFHEALCARDPGTLTYNIDARIIRAFHDELESGGLLSDAFEMVEEPAVLSSRPFSARWRDFRLTQDKTGFVLRFRESREKTACRFRLSPERPPIDVEALRKSGDADRGMPYNVYPRLSLEGRHGREPVRGLAWIDHQWGDPDGLMEEAGVKRVKAWDWFAVNFENGSDWLVYVLKDAQRGETLARMVVACDARGEVRFSRDVSLETTEFWESPRTFIRYPVGWRIKVPELAADVVFRPFAADQEIPVYGIHRAVWEGAGEISGVVGKRRAKGTARGEFHGYGYVFGLRDYFKARVERVDRNIESFLPKSYLLSGVERMVGPDGRTVSPEVYTKMLARPAWDLLARGGKRWRPMFALYLLEALGVASHAYEQFVCVMAELCHAGALIIDDIEDASSLRRGEPCVHLRYGLDVAISAANTLYFLPSLLIKEHPGLDDAQRLMMHEIYVRHMVRAHFGQAMDLFWSRNVSEFHVREWLKNNGSESILEMYALKTGAPLEGLAEMCAVVAGAAPPVRDACRAFARSLSIGFQILDDVHGFGGSSEWKKVRGEDIAEGKWTYVLFRALKALPRKDRDRLTAIVGRKDLRQRSDERETAIGLVKRSGALTACRDEALTTVDRAWEKVRPSLKPSEARVMLALLYKDLMDLKFD